YRLNVATVCCSPPSRSAMRTGCLMSLMPTLSMRMRRASARPWTSSIGFVLISFSNSGAHGSEDAGRIEPGVGEQLLAAAVVEETVGQTEVQRADRSRGAREPFVDGAAGPAGDGAVLDRDEELVRVGDARDQRLV